MTSSSNATRDELEKLARGFESGAEVSLIHPEGDGWLSERQRGIVAFALRSLVQSEKAAPIGEELEQAVKRAANWLHKGAPLDEAESTIRDVARLASRLSSAARRADYHEGYGDALKDVSPSSSITATTRNEIIEQVAQEIERAALTYFGPDPGGIKNIRDLIILAVRDMKQAGVVPPPSATTSFSRDDVIEECAKEVERQADACQPCSPAADQNWPFALKTCAIKLRRLKARADRNGGQQ